jgi:predicted RecA/RadA family phage recombinase
MAAYDAEQGEEVETILTGVHLLPKASETTAGALLLVDRRQELHHHRHRCPDRLRRH